MELTIDDLKIAIKVIDVAAERGAIKGEEMQIVGALRQKFVAVILSNEQAPEEQEQFEEIVIEEKSENPTSQSDE